MANWFDLGHSGDQEQTRVLNPVLPGGRAKVQRGRPPWFVGEGRHKRRHASTKQRTMAAMAPGWIRGRTPEARVLGRRSRGSGLGGAAGWERSDRGWGLRAAMAGGAMRQGGWACSPAQLHLSPDDLATGSSLHGFWRTTGRGRPRWGVAQGGRDVGHGGDSGMGEAGGGPRS